MPTRWPPCLAHEHAHVLERHPTEVAVTRAGGLTLVSFLVGDVFGGVVIAGVAEALLSAGYTREAEAEADAVAIELMDAVGWKTGPGGRVLRDDRRPLRRCGRGDGAVQHPSRARRPCRPLPRRGRGGRTVEPRSPHCGRRSAGSATGSVPRRPTSRHAFSGRPRTPRSRRRAGPRRQSAMVRGDAPRGVDQGGHPRAPRSRTGRCPGNATGRARR